MIQISGLYTPVPTPFLGEELNLDGFRRNVRHWMESSLTGLVVLGSNGEASHLTEQEADQLVEAARAEMPAGRPLIVGTGRESTRATLEATRRAAEHGADAVIVRTPGFYKGQMSTEVLVRHYLTVADASPVPVLLYNVQMYTGVSLSPAGAAALAEHPNVVGIKESGGDIAQIAEIVSRVPSDFPVLAGSATTFSSALCAGCSGGILALAALVPDLCFQMMEFVATGNLADARRLQQRLNPLARSVGSLYGVPGFKAALDWLGLDGGLPRLPLWPVSQAVALEIRQQLVDLGLQVRA